MTTLPDTGLDQRIAWFRRLAKGNLSVRVDQLADLNLVSEPMKYVGANNFHFTHETVVLAPDMQVAVRQRRVKIQGVLGYIEQARNLGGLPEIVVTDNPGDGRYWHLDGAHRLVAARLVGHDITADIWR